jgi:hypothetical protein
MADPRSASRPPESRRPPAWSSDRSDRTALVPFTIALRPIDLGRLREAAETRSLSPEVCAAEVLGVWLAQQSHPPLRVGSP